MGAIQKLKGILSNHSETRENHTEESLRSRYYKTTNKNAMKTLQELFNNMEGVTVKSVSEEHGEMAVQVHKGKKAFVIVTVISVRPFETAVDFSVTTETKLPFDFGYSRQLIKQMYERIDKSMIYIGSGLNSGKK
ncbi:cytosolic protein [Sutcliffiella horikoshii]|uniref:cytosolic protein n=1 Tax=Sutcliffiella horikoshii TaxID=79883 RepID=UPI001CFCE785|nr:cytosolic protein [Sutcliffiella horikoshii]